MKNPIKKIVGLNMHYKTLEFPTILVVHMGRAPSTDIMIAIGIDFNVRVIGFGQFIDKGVSNNYIIVFDTEGMKEAEMSAVLRWRQAPLSQLNSIIFITDAETKPRLFQASLNRDANLVGRPIVESKLIDLLGQLCLQRVVARKPDLVELRQSHYDAFPAQAEALRSADQILDEIFGAFASSKRIDAGEISLRSSQMIISLGETGLTDWVDAVRSHHDRTYQHCLLVTGTLLAFGHHLQMNRRDLERLAVGGLLHDLGKADIPLGILDKPGALTPDEQVVMRTHAAAGVARLKHVKGVTPQLIAFVGNHHEYLDGSGYPNRLTANEISDPVRLLTIADIFAALIERRSYKPEMPTEDALTILESMTTQLDQAILATVKPVLHKVRP